MPQRIWKPLWNISHYQFSLKHILFQLLLMSQLCMPQANTRNENAPWFLREESVTESQVISHVEKIDGLKFMAKLINAILAVFISLTLVYPIDLIKVRLQNQEVDEDGNYEYTSMCDCFKKVIITEGFFGLYSGMLIYLVLIMPEKAIQYAANDFLRYQFSLIETVNGYLPFYYGALAGLIAAFLQNLVTTPMELLKIRMQEKGVRMKQLDLDEAKKLDKTGPLSLGAQIIRKEGFFCGIYKGHLSTLSRDGLFNAYYFPILDLLVFRYGITDSLGEAPIWYTFLVAITAGGIGVWVMTPTDVIKSRMQGWEYGRYKGYCDCIRQTWKAGGCGAMYKGSVCRVLFNSLLYGFLQALYFMKVAERAIGLDLKTLNYMEIPM